MTRNFYLYVIVYYKTLVAMGARPKSSGKTMTLAEKKELDDYHNTLTRTEKSLLVSSGFHLCSVEGMPEMIIRYIIEGFGAFHDREQLKDDGLFTIAEMVDILTKAKQKEKQ